MAPKAKEFRYAVAVDLTGRITADGRAALQLDPAWTPQQCFVGASLNPAPRYRWRVSGREA